MTAIKHESLPRYFSSCRDEFGICRDHIRDCCPECMKILPGFAGEERLVAYSPETYELTDRGGISAQYLCGQGHRWRCWWSLGAGRYGPLGLDDDDDDAS